MKKIIPILIIITLAVFAFLSLDDQFFSPYVSIKKAKELSGQYVQIIGSLKKKSLLHLKNQQLSFEIEDEKADLLKIFYQGIKPYNFEHAQQVVLLGKYNKKKELFEAEKILTKCPSKYEKKVK